MAEIFFTADTHYHHANVIKFCGRPYTDIDHMNEALAENHNTVVGPKDTVWYLGDVMWKYFDLNRLNGDKKLIIGNHDSLPEIRHFFSEVNFYHALKGVLPARQLLVLMHYPIEDWNGRRHGSVHFHGHSHNTLSSHNLLRFDVGVDAIPGYRPVSLDEMLVKIKEKKEFLG